MEEMREGAQQDGGEREGSQNRWRAAEGGRQNAALTQSEGDRAERWMAGDRKRH